MIHGAEGAGKQSKSVVRARGKILGVRVFGKSQHGRVAHAVSIKVNPDLTLQFLSVEACQSCK